MVYLHCRWLFWTNVQLAQVEMCAICCRPASRPLPLFLSPLETNHSDYVNQFLKLNVEASCFKLFKISTFSSYFFFWVALRTMCWEWIACKYIFNVYLISYITSSVNYISVTKSPYLFRGPHGTSARRYDYIPRKYGRYRYPERTWLFQTAWSSWIQSGCRLVLGPFHPRSFQR